MAVIIGACHFTKNVQTIIQNPAVKVNSICNGNYTSQQNVTFFLVPQTSIDELGSTFYAEFRYVYRISLSGRVSKIQGNLSVQNSTLLAHGRGRNLSLKCRDV